MINEDIVRLIMDKKNKELVNNINLMKEEIMDLQLMVNNLLIDTDKIYQKLERETHQTSYRLLGRRVTVEIRRNERIKIDAKDAKVGKERGEQEEGAKEEEKKINGETKENKTDSQNINKEE